MDSKVYSPVRSLHGTRARKRPRLNGREGADGPRRALPPVGCCIESAASHLKSLALSASFYLTIGSGMPFFLNSSEREMMKTSSYSDPAERGLLRLFYRNWRPTRLGRWVNRLNCWWSGLRLPPRFQASLEVRGRKSGRTRSNPVVIASVEGRRYLVSMLGPGSDWVYVRIALSGREHFPLAAGAPLSDFEAIAGQYPVYRIDPM